MAKYWASVVAQRVSGQAIEWAGGVGFTRETGIEKFWRDSKIVSVYELVLRFFWCADARGFRVRSMKAHRISSCRQLRSLFRRSTRKMAVVTYIILL